MHIELAEFVSDYVQMIRDCGRRVSEINPNDVAEAYVEATAKPNATREECERAAEAMVGQVEYYLS